MGTYYPADAMAVMFLIRNAGVAADPTPFMTESIRNVPLSAERLCYALDEFIGEAFAEFGSYRSPHP